MKLVTFLPDDYEKVGCLRGDHIIDLREARALQLISDGVSVSQSLTRSSQEIPSNMINFIQGGQETLTIARQAEEFVMKNEKSSSAIYKLRDTKLKAPIPRPPIIVNMGNAYRPFKIKRFIFKPITGVIGPNAPIVIPKEISDFGAACGIELGVIIGKKGRRIPKDERAFEYVIGYTIYIDVADYGQQINQVLHLGKVYDTFCPMGPCIATKDEIEDPYDLVKKVWVNGQIACEVITQNMVLKIPEFVSYPSQTFTLLPGTVLSTGSYGMTRLKPGDQLEFEISKIGRMKHHVVEEK